MNKKIVGIIGAVVLVAAVGFSFIASNNKEKAQFIVIDNQSQQAFDTVVLNYENEKYELTNDGKKFKRVKHNVGFETTNDVFQLVLEVKNEGKLIGKSEETTVDFTKKTPTTFTVKDGVDGKVKFEIKK